MHSRRYVAVVAALFALALPASAAAHVELSPDRVPPGAFTLFTVLSPNESAQRLTALQLTIPDGLVVDSVADTSGFTTKVVEDERHRIAGLSWQGGDVAPDRLALFRFSATPRTSGLIQLSAIQHFADGTTRLWHSPQVDAAAVATKRDSLTFALAAVALALALLLGGGALAVALPRRRGAAALG